MRWYKEWGTLSGSAEHYMMCHAEQHRKQLEKIHKKKSARENVPAFNLHKKQEGGVVICHEINT